jgi:hypothetical protein
MAARFGALPIWVVERLEKAEVAQLDVWADRALKADTLEQVFS